MPRTTKIALSRLVATQKRLRALPVVDTRKEPEEALAMLAQDVRDALQKGYSLKQIREIFIEMNVPLTAAMVRRHLAQAAPPVEKEASAGPEETVPEAVLESGGEGERTSHAVELKTSLDEMKTVPSATEKSPPADAGGGENEAEAVSEKAREGENAPPDGAQTVPKAKENPSPSFGGIIVKPDTPDSEL